MSSPRVAGPRMFTTGVLLLALEACLVGSPAFVNPAPSDTAQLVSRIEADSTDLRAAVGLAILDLLSGRAPRAHARLARLHDLAPDDPAVPLLLARAEEELGEVAAARDRYVSYVRTRRGILAERAAARLGVVQPGALRADARQLLEGATPELAPDRRAVVVLPLAVSGPNPRREAIAVAAATLMESRLRAVRLRPLDAQTVRLFLEEAGVGASERGALSIGEEVGSRLGAARIVQGTMRSFASDSVAWDVTVMTLGEGARDHIVQLSVQGAAGEDLEMERRLAPLVLTALGVEVTRTGPAAPLTGSLEALVSFGDGLRAIDAGDFRAARDHLTGAVRLDASFDEPRALLALTQAAMASAAVPLGDALEEVARVGELQRAVLALHGSARSMYRSALTRLGVRERPGLAEMMGVERAGGTVLLDLTFTQRSWGP